MKNIFCIYMFMLLIIACKQTRSSDLETAAEFVKPKVSSPYEKWTSSQIVGVWQGISYDSKSKQPPCEFVFFEDGSGYANEEFSMTSLLSPGVRERLDHELFWTVNKVGVFRCVMISKANRDNRCVLNAIGLQMEKENGFVKAIVTDRYSEIRLDAEILKISDIAIKESSYSNRISRKMDRLQRNNSKRESVSPLSPSIVHVGACTNPYLSTQFVGAWSGVTTTWPINYMFKLVLINNGTGSLEEGFSKTACDAHKIIKHKLFWMAGENSQSCSGLAVAIAEGLAVDLYDFSFKRQGNEYVFNITKNGSDITDVAKIWKVSSE